jgi:hypothetical protein
MIFQYLLVHSAAARDDRVCHDRILTESRPRRAFTCDMISLHLLILDVIYARMHV